MKLFEIRNTTTDHTLYFESMEEAKTYLDELSEEYLDDSDFDWEYTGEVDVVLSEILRMLNIYQRIDVDNELGL